jgi:hypothetical protein
VGVDCLTDRARIGTASLLVILALSGTAHGEDERLAKRSARLLLEDTKPVQLTISVPFREVLSPEIQAKLTRGLPTSILFTAAVFANGSEDPIGTTVQTCRVTWHVWEEAYRVELNKANLPTRTEWTTTLEGVMRRCGEARRLPIALGPQFRRTMALSVRARVLVNPIGEALLQKIKRWVSRPTGTNTSAPGDALFGTFTGFFMQHVGEAEHIAVFETTPSVPVEAGPPER